MTNKSNGFNHYFKDVSNLQNVDVYRVLELFNVVSPSIQHAVKKLLVAGGRGAGKDITQDIQEAIASLERWKEMWTEDAGTLLVDTNETLLKLSQMANKLAEANDRIYDLMLGDDGQAYKEARKYLDKHAPHLYDKLNSQIQGAVSRELVEASEVDLRKPAPWNEP